MRNIINYLARLIVDPERAKNQTNESSEFNDSFRTEIDIIKGCHINTNSHKSIIHFSFNKAATQYVKSVLTRIAIENGMSAVSINDYAFNSKFPFLDHLTAEQMEQYKHIFKYNGYLYSVFGGMVEGIENVDRYKIILSVRDPRDMLVSSYYSQAFSHIPPDVRSNKYDNFMHRRKFALSNTVDEYVMAEAVNIKKTFLRYNELLLSQYSQHVHIVRYEDMIHDYENWLGSIVSYCELTLSDSLKSELIKENVSLKPSEEDVHSHIRKGMPGDYREKLLPKTILKLNDIMSDMLERFRYDY